MCYLVFISTIEFAFYLRDAFVMDEEIQRKLTFWSWVKIELDIDPDDKVGGLACSPDIWYIC